VHAGVPPHASAAQVAVLAGDRRLAEEGLRRSGEVLERLPASVTEDANSVMGWGEAQLRYTEAWVYSHLGDAAKADSAADRALQLYPRSDSRSPVQIKLMQAFARTRSGDVSEGIRSAGDVYQSLHSEHRTVMVGALAQRVLTSVPDAERKRADVEEYRELVTATSRKMIES
jgi:hypothetical protein